MGIHDSFFEGRNDKRHRRAGGGASPRWEVYIAALRGNRTSIAPDLHKIKAENA